MPAKYRFQKVRVGRIDIDAYQRDLKMTHVSKIVDNFDLDAVHVPILSLRNGRFYAIDGQQSLAAVREKLGDQHEVHCKVFTGLSAARENALFVKLNNSMTVAPYEKLNARIESGDKGAADFVEAVESTGFTVQRPRGPKGFTGTATLEETFKNNAEGLQWALGFIQTTWPTESKPNVYVIAGLARFHAMRFKVNPSRLARAWSSCAQTTGELKRLAHKATLNTFGGSGHNLKSGLPIAKGLMVLYNENRPPRTDKLVWGEE